MVLRNSLPCVQNQACWGASLNATLPGFKAKPHVLKKLAAEQQKWDQAAESDKVTVGGQQKQTSEFHVSSAASSKIGFLNAEQQESIDLTKQWIKSALNPSVNPFCGQTIGKGAFYLHPVVSPVRLQRQGYTWSSAMALDLESALQSTFTVHTDLKSALMHSLVPESHIPGKLCNL